IHLSDIATCIDGTERPRRLGRANLRPAVTFTIVKKRGADAIQTAENCKAIFRKAASQFPEGVKTQVLSESTKFIKTRINTVTQNGLQALILVTLLLLLFLDWRIALLVGIGIPVSFAGALIVLYLSENTINLLSLFALIMALGMVVDDAIVMAENCYRLIQSGFSPIRAAIDGAKEVFWPIVGSVSTTIAAFLPLIWGEGIIGKFLAIVPLVVITALIFSILQAFFVLPSHIADFVRPGSTPEQIAAQSPSSLFGKLRKSISLTYAELRQAVDSFLQFIIRLYLDALVLCLRWRYWSIGAFIAALFALVALIATGAVPFKLFSTDFADLLIVKLQLPHDYSLRQTEAVVSKLEERIAAEIPNQEILGIITRIGAKLDPTEQFLEYGENLAMITIDLDEENPAARKPSTIARHIQRILTEFPQFVSATAKPKEGGPPVGKPINIELRGPDFPQLLEIAQQLQQRLASTPGILNPTNDFPPGKTEYSIQIDESLAIRAGLDTTDVSLATQALFRGVEATRLRWGNDEVILRVKAPETFLQNPQNFYSLQILNREGQPVALDQIATIQPQSISPRIKRKNTLRAITVSADVDERVTTPRAANKLIKSWLNEILPKYPDCRAELSGENRDTERSLKAMKFSAVVALLLIYTLLAVITNSFLQPLV
ncbi:MAG: efflux RND transporter permease subunit, partial [Chthoniobacterales bacterium]|nr:efflux RND transporter permease subunit [Chthoniobacterales bacterium]